MNIPYIPLDRLSINDLRNILFACWEARIRWNRIGISLNLSKDDLEAIELKCRRDVGDCFIEMLAIWLRQRNPYPTQVALSTALKQPLVGLADIAESLEAMDLNAGDRSFSQTLDSAKPVTPVSTEITFPHLEELVPDEHTRKELERRLSIETQDIKLEFCILCNRFFDLLEIAGIPIPRLLRYLSSALETDNFSPEPTAMAHIYNIIKAHSSFFNYKLVGYMIELAGNTSDKECLENYLTKFTEYTKRRIYECPSTFGTALTTSDSELHLKLDSKYDGCKANELEEFQDRICIILKRQGYVFRLLSIKKGCFELTYAVSKHILEATFPVSAEQKQKLRELGVLTWKVLEQVNINYKVSTTYPVCILY